MDYLSNAFKVFEKLKAMYKKIALMKNADITLNLDESLSSDEISDVLKKLFGTKVPVVTYSDIFNENTSKEKNFLRKYLTNIPQRMVVFLYRQSPTYGHWCCMFEHPITGELYLFDSYGKELPDEYITGEKGKNGPYKIKSLGQESPFLLECFINSSYDHVIWNDHKFQKSGENVQTCGKWCVIRLAYSLLDIDEFNERIDSVIKEHNLGALGYDNLVCFEYSAIKNYFN